MFSRTTGILFLLVLSMLGACDRESKSEASDQAPATPRDEPASVKGQPAAEKAAGSAMIDTKKAAEKKDMLKGQGTENPNIKGEEVSYEADGMKMVGYLAYDTSIEGPRPGILVVHEWWGHNDYARMRARMLAELGYTALAVDMYGNGKQAEHPDDAKKFSSAVFQDLKQATARFEAAKKLLEQHASTDPEKTSAIGYCFGGGVVLHMARAGVDLDSVASFHGSLATQTPAKQGDVKAKVLVLHGAADPFVSTEHVTAFQEEMKKAGVALTFKEYEGAKHAFTNPKASELGKKFEIPIAYDEKADKESWEELKAFLAATYPND